MGFFEEHLINPPLSVSLSVFEGPLDLLLFLVRRNEVDIYDIPIETITGEYLEVLRQMETLNLEIAGEFLVMAATLMYIKSRMLLPRSQADDAQENDDEEIDPRWELIQQLLDYKRFKEAAGALETLIIYSQDVLPRQGPACEPPSARPLQPCDRLTLWNTFNRVLQRLAERIAPAEIEVEPITIAEQMEWVLRELDQRSSLLFSSLFPGDTYSLQRVVATFLALLELARLKTIALEQSADFADIRLLRL